MTYDVCNSLRSQLGELFDCEDAGSRVQIHTPFVLPDGDGIDLYWRETPRGQVVSDLGDTLGWLFINGGNSGLTKRQDDAYDQACSMFAVERRNGVLIAGVADGNIAEAVIRLAQAITVVSQVLDIEPATETVVVARSASQITADRISTAMRNYTSYGWRYRRNVKVSGRSKHRWAVDFMVDTGSSESALMALHGRRYRGWQTRAIEHVFAVFSDLAPTFAVNSAPVKAIAVIDDTDVAWFDEPVELLRNVSEVVMLSQPDELRSAIDSGSRTYIEV